MKENEGIGSLDRTRERIPKTDLTRALRNFFECSGRETSLYYMAE